MSISAKAAIAAYSGAVLYKRYEQQAKTTTFLKIINDMRENFINLQNQAV